MTPSYARRADTNGVTRARFIQIAFGCMSVFVVMFVPAAALDATWLRLASLLSLFAAFIAYEIWLWWNDRIYPAIFFGLLVAAFGAGFIGHRLS